jgi:hypothetical protein
VRDQTQTPQFKSWFGKSQVVDPHGNPQVMYPGTTIDFNSFDPKKSFGKLGAVFFSSDPDFASEIVGSKDGAQLYPVYLRAENLFDPADPNHLERLRKQLDADHPLGIWTSSGFRPASSMVDRIGSGRNYWGVEDPMIFNAARKSGFDGVRVSEHGIDNIAVFDAKQVKSASSNKGTFSPKNKDIRFATRGQSSTWSAPQQEHSSAGTSIPQVPAVMKAMSFQPGTVNADIGGGKFDHGTEFLKAKGVENLVYDPFNRSKEHNAQVAKRLRGGKADTATVANVLNVIKEPEARQKVIQQAAAAIKPGGTAYFQIYEGAGHGQGGQTKAGWQNHRRTADYLAEIQQVFGSVVRKGNVLIASQPIKTKHTRLEEPVRYSLAEEWASRYCELITN